MKNTVEDNRSWVKVGECPLCNADIIKYHGEMKEYWTCFHEPKETEIICSR